MRLCACDAGKEQVGIWQLDLAAARSSCNVDMF